VRQALKDEQFETLDRQTRALDESMLVIADNEKAVAIAGVMGGANSEIGGDTAGIILESANFNFFSIRQAEQKLGLRTEASIRFEKSLDPHMCAPALARAAQLVLEICPGAKIASQAADEKDNKNFEIKPLPIELDMGWLHKFIGENIREKKVVDILHSLGFTAVKIDKKLIVEIPSWRATKDIAIKEDLAEEIARVYGYDELVPSMPAMEMKMPEKNKEREAEMAIKILLSGASGLAEVENYSFVGEDQLKKLGIDYKNYIRVANPVATNQAILRQSLVPNLLNNVKTNQSRYDEFGLFEIGTVFFDIEGDLMKDAAVGDKLPYQEKRLGLVLAGKDDSRLFGRIKGVIKYLTDNLSLSPRFEAIENVPAWADAGMSAKISIFEKLIGFIYKLDNAAAARNGIKKEVFIAEISLKELFKFIIDKPAAKFAEFEKYPPVVRDLAFIVHEKVLYNDLRAAMLAFHPYIKNVELFDVFQSEKLGKGNKNIAFNIIYQADKTLTAAEVDEIQAGLIKKIETKFEAKMRNF
jgi:phenylalanyl-tRNA synthetase beta chain